MDKWKKDERERSQKTVVTIDELIDQIDDTEALDLPGFMDKETQERVEARIMNEICRLQEKESTGETFALSGRKKGGRKRFAVLALAAVLLMGLCIGVFAGSNPDWDVEILKFMGLNGSETFQLESGEVEIQVYDSCEAVEKTGIKEVKIMAVSSIGDRNSGCIRVETDYELPEGFDEETDYIMPRNYSLNILDRKGKFIEHGSTTGYMNMDGKLGYMIYIIGCEGLNTAQIKLKFEDFYLYHDLGMETGGKEKELLLEGTWELTWKYAYQSNTKRYKMLKSIEIDGEKFYITQIDVSPLSVWIRGFRMPWDRKKGHAEFSIDRIGYKDGTVLNVGGWSSSGNRDGIWIDTFLGTTEMGTTIDADKIESIVIDGNEIQLKR